MRISTSPVGRSLFTVSGVRATTLPVSVSTHSERARIHRGEGRRIRLDHALGDAVMVAQVDEDQPAMIAPAIDPARQAHGLRRHRLCEAGRRYGCDRRAWAKPCKSWRKAGFLAVYGGRVKGRPSRADWPVFPVTKPGYLWPGSEGNRHEIRPPVCRPAARRLLLAAPSRAAAPHNIIIFVADGLRYGSVTPDNMPNMCAAEERGRGFHQQPFALSHHHHGQRLGHRHRPLHRRHRRFRQHALYRRADDQPARARPSASWKTTRCWPR